MKKKWKFNPLLAEDDGGDGGSQGLGIFEGDDNTPQPEGAPAEGQPATPPAPTVDAAALAREFGEIIGRTIPKPEPQQPQYTPEQAKKLLNIWEPTPEWLARYDNLETRNQAIMEQRDGMLRQFDTLVQFRLQELQNQFGGALTPVRQFIEQQEASAREARFDKTYPTLANKELKPLILAVALQLKQQGKQFNSEEKLFEALAKGAEATIKVQNPNFSLQLAGASPQVKNNNGRAGNSIPVTTPGAGGGVGKSGQAPQTKKPGLAIFDP